MAPFFVCIHEEFGLFYPRSRVAGLCALILEVLVLALGCSDLPTLSLIEISTLQGVLVGGFERRNPNETNLFHLVSGLPGSHA